MSWLVLLTLLGSIVLAFRAARRLVRRSEPLDGEARDEAHCACGYPLRELALARCPECGRVIGFDATPEELGLEEEHLRRVQVKRETRGRLTAAELHGGPYQSTPRAGDDHTD